MALPIHVSAVQYADVPGSRGATQDKALHLMDDACLMSDLVLLPELPFAGHWLADQFGEIAHPIFGPITAVVGQIAVTRSSFICFGLIESDMDKIYNTVALVSSDGSLIGSHRKINLTDAERRAGLTPGEGVTVFSTHLGRIGILLGEDVFDSEHIRVFRRESAQLVLIPSVARSESMETAGSTIRDWENALRSLAKDVECHVIWANKIGRQDGAFAVGGSMVIDSQGDTIVRGSVDMEEIVRTSICLSGGMLGREAA